MGAKRIFASLALILTLSLLAMPMLSAKAEDTGAATVNKCGSTPDKDGVPQTPWNCLFLEEPIGGKPGYDLYRVDCTDGKCVTTLWNGEAIVAPANGNVRGPIQAVLTSTAGKENQGPFGLLYSYLSLIYTYMSGLIIGISVMFVVIGGIQITISKQDEGVTQGKARIIKAITGVILWFTASLILYTINPTFFTISAS